MSPRRYDRRTIRENISPVDWARVAAYIDGEGCIQICSNSSMLSKPKNRRSLIHALVITVVNTDARLITWLCDTLNVGRYYIKPKSPSIKDENWNQQYVWTCTSNNAANVLRGCLDYFIIKREQAEIAIEFQATKGYRSRGRLRQVVPTEVIEFRTGLQGKLKSLHGVGLRMENIA